MTNEKLHGEIHTLVNNYGFIAIIKALKVDAARRHFKWADNVDSARGSAISHAQVMADRMAEIRRALSNCLRHLVKGAG